MDSSQRQKPQRAPGDKATVDRLFLLDLSDNRVVSLVASKRGDNIGCSGTEATFRG